MIPANIDYQSLISDLNRWGIRDYKIEAICGLPEGRIAKIKCGATKDMVYPNAARFYNFWWDEAVKRGYEVSHGTSSLQPLGATTT